MLSDRCELLLHRRLQVAVDPNRGQQTVGAALQDRRARTGNAVLGSAVTLARRPPPGLLQSGSRSGSRDLLLHTNPPGSAEVRRNLQEAAPSGPPRILRSPASRAVGERLVP